MTNAAAVSMATRQQVMLERLKTGNVSHLETFLKDAADAIRKQLSKGELTAYSKARLEAQLTATREALADIYGKAAKRIDDDLREYADYAGGAEARAMDALLKETVELAVPSPAQIYSAAYARPLGSGPTANMLKPFIEKWATNSVDKVDNALRLGYFDVAYSKPYQMDAEIYQGDVLIDNRIFLFEGVATGRGFMVGLQNLYFPNWDTRRFYFASPDTLADGFFWGLKELGFYWGTGNIRLQNNLDLVEKYTAFYKSETGHQPSVSFLRQIFHAVIGYKFNRRFKVLLEYRYANYSLALIDSYSDDTYNNFLNHAINRDTVQQLAVNLTIGF